MEEVRPRRGNEKIKIVWLLPLGREQMGHRKKNRRGSVEKDSGYNGVMKLLETKNIANRSKDYF